MSLGRNNLAAKRQKNAQLSSSTIKHWLNFILNLNPYPELKIPNEKLISSYKKYCTEQGHDLLSQEKCNHTTYKARVYLQIYEPIIEGRETFDLCDGDLERITQKFKK